MSFIWKQLKEHRTIYLKTLTVLQEADNEVGGWVDRSGDGEVNGSERLGVGEEGRTFLNLPECFRLRKKTAM